MSIRIIPHPEKSKRVFKTKTAKLDQDGKVVRPAKTLMYRYLVVASSPEALRAYRLARGTFYREITEGDYKGTPLWNDQRRFTKPMELYITQDGTNVGVAEDDFKLAMLSKMQEAKQFGPEFEKAIASRLADIFVSDLANPHEHSMEKPAVQSVPKTVEDPSSELDLEETEEEEVEVSDEEDNDPLNIG
jgi:hypothetical protein